ncbi:MAG: hypothetical protein MH132_11670 [Hydrotalea sp.]|nr:hypothetical protein [Hydrotalea sp.]
MRFSFIVILITSFIHFAARSQSSQIGIKGYFSGVELRKNEQLRIRFENEKNEVIGYLPLFEKREFSVQLNRSDSLLIFILGESFPAIKFKSLFPQKDTCIHFNIDPKVAELDEVTVFSQQPIKISGDTTFYNVNFFKEVNDFKLVDLISKLPYFTISGDGSLYFKAKPVEKIMIEGQELFSDKVQLLMKNIPIHLIEKIQALENQSSSKLAKSFKNENRVFLNIELDNSKKSGARFGDFSGGIGDLNRYILNITAFQISKSLNIGFIGQNDHSGLNAGSADFNEVMTVFWGNPIPSLMNVGSPFFRLIPRYEQFKYLINRRNDQRIHITKSLGKEFVFSSEIGYIKDFKQQEYQNQLTTLSNNNTFTRNENTTWVQDPRYIYISTQIKNHENKKYSLDLTNTVISENTNANEQILNRVQFDTNFSNLNNAQRMTAIKSQFNLMHLLNSQYALSFHLTWHHWFMNQNFLNNSDAISSAFQINDPLFNIQNLISKNTLSNLSLKVDLMNKKSAQNIYFQVNRDLYNNDQSNSFSNLNGDKLFISALNHIHRYNHTKISTGFNKGFNSYSYKISFDITAGMNILHQYSTVQTNVKNIVPNLKFAINQKISSIKKIDINLLTSFEKGLPEISRFRDYPFFQNINSIHRSQQMNLPRERISIFATFIDKMNSLQKRKIANTITLVSDIDLVSYISGLNYGSIYSFINDSAIRKPTFFINASWYAMYFPKTRSLSGRNTFEVSYFQAPLFANTRIYSSNRISLLDEIELTAKHKSLYKFSSFLGFKMNYFTVPVLENKQFTTDVWGKLNFDYYHKNLTISVNNTCFANNLGLAEYSALFSLDIKFSYTLPQKKYSLELGFYNLLDQKDLRIIQNSIWFQQFTSIPVLPRNFLFNIKRAF